MNRQFFSILWQAAQEWFSDSANTLAAAIAYYTAISMAPLLLLATSVAGFFIGEEIATGELASFVESTIGPNAAEVVETAVRNSAQITGSGLGTALSIGGILIGATIVFMQLQFAMNVVWDAVPEGDGSGSVIRNMIVKRLISLGMVLATGFLLLVSLIISTLLAALNDFLFSRMPLSDLLSQGLNLSVSLLVIGLIFMLIFKYLPDCEVPWRSAWFGGLLTAFLFVFGQYLLGAYLGRAAPTSAYGAAGSLVLILLWVYYSAMILLFGAEFSKVYTHETEPEHYSSSTRSAIADSTL